MKYLITESKIKKVVLRYLDDKNFVMGNGKNYVFFVNSEDDEYAQIIYIPFYEKCYFNFELVDEISSFFNLDSYDVKDYISNWVENTLEVSVRTYHESGMNIPVSDMKIN